MALILCIETGTDVCSVGLANNGEIIAIQECSGNRNHAQKVAVYANELLEMNDLEAKDLDAVAVSKGPGSYTGLRIGVSFAKGLCYALNIPLIAIGSLDSLVSVVREEHEASLLDVEGWESAVLAPMIDARRMEVYTQLFDSKGVALNEVEAKVIDAESFAEQRNAAQMVIFGDGAAKCSEVLEGVRYIEVAPSARGLSRLAQEAFDRQQFEDVSYFDPFYLKDFVVTASKKKLF